MVTQDSDTSLLRLELQQTHPTLCVAAVIIPNSLVSIIRTQASLAQQQLVQTHGFARGEVPLNYIEQNFKKTLSDHVQEFLFKYLVINFLYKNIRDKKILVAGEPRLTTIDIQPGQDAVFNFELTLFSPLELQEWKYFPFKAPKRKKYKDLDRQVDSFIKEEKENFDKVTDSSIHVSDWVNFDIFIVDAKNQPLFNDHKENLWLKIGDEEADATLRDIFIGKNIGDTFFSNNKGLQEYFSDEIDTRYNFCITIHDVLQHSFFCLENFKRYFKLKTNKEVYQKLIEVFSYRNDLSQRRSMVEETLKLLLSKHRFTVPNHLILRQQKIVLAAIQHNPDYHVYRMQKDFNERVRQLAEKQAKEALIMDQIGYQENITASHQDIKTYLNLTKRPRTKEFIYFTHPLSRIGGQETPIATEELKLACSREKTLNHIIYHLTQK